MRESRQIFSEYIKWTVFEHMGADVQGQQASLNRELEAVPRHVGYQKPQHVYKHRRRCGPRIPQSHFHQHGRAATRQPRQVHLRRLQRKVVDGLAYNQI